MSDLDPLTLYAFVGTAGGPSPAAHDPTVDAVFAALSETPVERRVLLAAGARATAHMAGAKAVRHEEDVATATAETRAAVSPNATLLLGRLLRGEHTEILPEALALVARAGLRLPHALLPLALDVRESALRAAVHRVMGERGPWLARLKPSWAWARADVAATATSFDALERLWNDGLSATRRTVFAAARSRDAARARALLEAAWSTEKAEERATLLALLEINLRPDDEPFLEARLRDRASSVREVACDLLPRIPTSAFVARMTARADAMLAKVTGTDGVARLEITSLASVDDAAERDGLVAKPPGKAGARAFWLTRALAAVPPAHWAARFGLEGAPLVASLAASDWAGAAAEGLTRAALVHDDTTLLKALWDFWSRVDTKTVDVGVVASMLHAIVQRLSTEDAEARLAPLLLDESARLDIASALALLPTPWSERFGITWLEAMRTTLTARAPTTRAYRIAQTLARGAVALPEACLARALEPFPLDTPYATLVDRFQELIRLRQSLVQEISP